MKGKHGVHEYNLEHYGMTEQQVRSATTSIWKVTGWSLNHAF